MRLVQILAASVALVVPCIAAAQTHPCNPPVGSFPRLQIAPQPPRSSDAISITVGEYNFVPAAVTSTVRGTTIDVTLYGQFNTFSVPLPPGCGTVQVGPMPVGTYQVRYLLGGQIVGTPTTLRATVSVDVVPDLSAIPTLSVVDLIATAVGLALTGGLFLGHSRPSHKS